MSKKKTFHLHEKKVSQMHLYLLYVGQIFFFFYMTEVSKTHWTEVGRTGNFDI